MSVKLKPITETSWLVTGDTEDIRIGLLTEIKNQYVLMVKGEKKQFLDRKAVNNYFEEDVFDNVIEQSEATPDEKEYYINGYPVDYTPYEVILKGTNLPLISKKPTSEVYYSAGYYCLNFPKNWMPAYCPKLSTLAAYEFSGPYKTELEMRTMLVKLRKEKTKKK